jgi:hypothetical protein
MATWHVAGIHWTCMHTLTPKETVTHGQSHTHCYTSHGHGQSHTVMLFFAQVYCSFCCEKRHVVPLPQFEANPSEAKPVQVRASLPCTLVATALLWNVCMSSTSCELELLRTHYCKDNFCKDNCCWEIVGLMRLNESFSSKALPSRQAHLMLKPFGAERCSGMLFCQGDPWENRGTTHHAGVQERGGPDRPAPQGQPGNAFAFPRQTQA